MSLKIFWGHNIGVDYDTYSSGDGVTIPAPVAISPTAGEVEVIKSTTITVNITNAAGAVVLSPLTVINVLGVTVWSGDAQQGGWTGVKNVIGSGFQYVLTPPVDFIYGAPISVTVYAENDQGMFITYPYVFHVESSVTPYPSLPFEDTSVYENTDIMFPFMFTQDGDLPLIHDNYVIEQNMRLGALLNKGGIPLKTEIGSRIIRSVFDINSFDLQGMLGLDVRESINNMKLDVLVAGVDVEEDEHELNLSVPYKYMKNNRGWKTLQINIPKNGEVV